MEGLAEIFSNPLSLSFVDPIVLSLIFTMVGIIFGFAFYGLSYLKKSSKKVLGFGIPGFIIILLLSTYSLMGPRAYINLLILILKILFIFVLCSIPIFGIYGILKNKKNIILGVGGGLLIFFFFTELLLSHLTLITDQIYFLILFFIIIIFFIEIGTSMIFFKNSFDKISFIKTNNAQVILRLNSVISKYLAYVTAILLICYFFTFFVYFYTVNIAGENVIFDIGSNFGTWFFLVIIMISLISLWYLIPSEKKDVPDNNSK
jgi:hypothetical protein